LNGNQVIYGSHGLPFKSLKYQKGFPSGLYIEWFLEQVGMKMIKNMAVGNMLIC
tara:strand:- start:6276 stop:6437 length:162 start_codon:yes stop_codon:yes gene_type:complete